MKKKKKAKKRLPPKQKNKTKIETARNYDIDATPADMLDELITHCVQESKSIEEHEKINDLQQEISKVNELEAKLIGKL